MMLFGRDSEGDKIQASLTMARNACECCIIESGASILVPYNNEVEAYSNSVKS